MTEVFCTYSPEKYIGEGECNEAHFFRNYATLSDAKKAQICYDFLGLKILKINANNNKDLKDKLEDIFGINENYDYNKIYKIRSF